MRFIGIDLAWSEGRSSGVVVLDAQGRPEASAYLEDLGAVASFCLARAALGPVAVGVDAPLKVPNATGQRAAERELLRVFAEHRLGAHVANRQRLLKVHGAIRGEQLVRLLAGRFRLGAGAVEGHVAADGSGVGGNPGTRGLPGVLLEVYPHAALIAWFDLDRPLAYKRGPLQARVRGLRRLARLLASLKSADPPLDLGDAVWLPDPEWEPAWEGATLAGARHLESLMDAAVCAHVVRYWYRWGLRRCRVFGSAAQGEIVTPVPRALWADEGVAAGEGGTAHRGEG